MMMHIGCFNCVWFYEDKKLCQVFPQWTEIEDPEYHYCAFHGMHQEGYKCPHGEVKTIHDTAWIERTKLVKYGSGNKKTSGKSKKGKSSSLGLDK